MEARDHAGLIAAVARYGDESRGGDPQLWAEVLQYFVTLPPDDECEAQVGCLAGHTGAACLPASMLAALNRPAVDRTANILIYNAMVYMHGGHGSQSCGETSKHDGAPNHTRMLVVVFA
jgi:hypothetical protein